jgi:RecA/RadA recombinase
VSERCIASGLKPLDSLIGGWRRGIITLLIGESGAGKSTLLIASAYHAAKNGLKVSYIDTEGNPVEEAIDRLPEAARRNVNVEHATGDMDALEDSVRRLKRLPRDVLDGGLIIVDSVTYHYHSLIRAAESDAERDRLQSRLETVIYGLHALAVENDSAAVITTWPTSVYDPEGDFVGGFAVKTYSRTHLRIQPSAMSNRRMIEVVKHQNPGLYRMQAEISMDEVMRLLDMSPASGMWGKLLPEEVDDE